MKKIFLLSCLLFSELLAQPALNKIMYSSEPNHRELVVQCLNIACMLSNIDTVSISYQDIKKRLEAGVYSEDYDPIPGIVGEHFPDPWNQGPSFNFQGYFPFAKIPYGIFIDTSSGWKRGFYHGYDPVHGYIWPGSDMTTVQWANSPLNNFTWNNAVSLYRSGHKAEAYECMGHLLHLLMDMSVPAHIKVVNHGMSIGSLHAGTFLDPDILVLIVDEYELALSGGVSIPNYNNFIPDNLDAFINVLQQANISILPDLDNWEDYFTHLAEYTYNDSLVNKYYSGPVSNGGWGAAKNSSGNIVQPTPYFLTIPPAQIGNRYVQVSLRSTANLNGTILPPADILLLCTRLIPAALTYGSGLLQKFSQTVSGSDDIITLPVKFYLAQNYPNPFNSSTAINYSLQMQENVRIIIYDALGRKVCTLLNEEKPAGAYSINFDAGNLSSGTYFCQIRAGEFIETKKMVLMK